MKQKIIAWSVYLGTSALIFISASSPARAAEGSPNFVGTNYATSLPDYASSALNAYWSSPEIREYRAQFQKRGDCKTSSVTVLELEAAQTPGGGAASFLISELCSSNQFHRSINAMVNVARVGSPSGEYSIKPSKPRLVKLTKTEE